MRNIAPVACSTKRRVFPFRWFGESSGEVRGKPRTKPTAAAILTSKIEKTRSVRRQKLFFLYARTFVQVTSAKTLDRRDQHFDRVLSNALHMRIQGALGASKCQ